MTCYDPRMSDRLFAALIVRAEFGQGSGRDLFAVPSDPAVVVKRQRQRFPYENMLEWTLWSAVRGTVLEPCFGACLSISDSGRYLMMERLDDIAPADYPHVPPVPAWLADYKPDAFGKTRDGHIKVRDYGSVALGGVLAQANLTRIVFAA